MAMELDAQQNMYAAGVFNPISGALSDGLVVKFTSGGTVAWDSTYNNSTAVSPLEFFNCIALDMNGNVFVGGQSNQNWVTAKYTPLGVREWTQNYSYSFRPDSVCTIAIDNNNNVIVGGVFGQGSEQDFGIIKYRNDSVQVWVKKFANSAGSDDILTQIAIDDTNNIYAIGWETENFTTNYQMLLLKYDSLGTLEYDVAWTDPLGIAPDYGKKIAIDASSNLYIMGDASDHCFGNVFFNGYRWDIQVMKYGYSTSIGLSEQSSTQNQAILLYPNPAKNQFNIRLNTNIFNNNPVHISFYDMNGRLIQKIAGTHSSEISVDASSYPAGMLFFIAEQGTIRETGKVMILK
jgi:predicted secreted protein